ncbi:CB068 protein, partial [Grantiella picta]|nr:CB068 protein [Grantiella picta]
GWRCRPGGRLDMSHGFVRHIRRNQLARDAYDRAVRQARGRARTRLTPAPARPRRPDQQVYRPRRGNVGTSKSGAPCCSGCCGRVLWGGRCHGWEFRVAGGARVLWVPQGDSAEEVTRQVCARSPLEPPLRRALCQRVQDELSKRRGTG